MKCMVTDFSTLPSMPWSGNQLKKLRKAIVTGRDSTDTLSYVDVSEWYSTIIGYVVSAMQDVDYSGIGLSTKPFLSFRVKTIDTLRYKLIARHGLQINHIHDIMGLRVTADMTLDMQDIVVERISSIMPTYEISDIRDNPHSGYRAVHIIIKLPNGAFAEIQVRTLLQDIWANCFEEIGDMYGREIRYGGKPIRDDFGIVNTCLTLGDEIHALEVQVNENIKDPQRAPFAHKAKDIAVSLMQALQNKLLKLRDNEKHNG